MLVRLFGRNFRSLKDDFELSLVAADLRREEDCKRGVIEVPLKGWEEPLRLLRCIALYGQNASGKSNVLTAARALSWLTSESSAQGRPDAKIPPYESFLLDDTTRTAPIVLGCDVTFEERGVQRLLRYQVTYASHQIQYESLTLLEDSERNLFERDEKGRVAGELISASPANKLYVAEMQPNVTVLSKLGQHGPARGKGSVRPYYRAIVAATAGEDYFAAPGGQEAEAHEVRFADDADYRDWIMQRLIRAADIGIVDVKVYRENTNPPPSLRELAKLHPEIRIPESQVVVNFVHSGASPRALPFRMESSGTRKLFHIASHFWRLAHESRVLFVDELSASLHPLLLDGLVRSVNAASEAKSQMIFATHDTGLLEGRDGEPPALRRDQVYFTKKSAQGASELYSLAEFAEDARPVHNLRKRYLSGVYGAVPLTEGFSL